MSFLEGEEESSNMFRVQEAHIEYIAAMEKLHEAKCIYMETLKRRADEKKNINDFQMYLKLKYESMKTINQYDDYINSVVFKYVPDKDPYANEEIRDWMTDNKPEYVEMPDIHMGEHTISSYTKQRFKNGGRGNDVFLGEMKK